MFNLLPQITQEALRRQYRVRIGIVILWLSFVALSIASVTLIPSELLSSQKEDAAQRRFDTLTKSAEKGNTNEFNKVLLEAKSILGLLHHNEQSVFLHELLLQVASMKTGRISLTNFSFSKVSEGKRQVDISGVAMDRTALAAFVSALEETGLFKKVDIPLSNFAKDTNIEFSMKAIVGG